MTKINYRSVTKEFTKEEKQLYKILTIVAVPDATECRVPRAINFSDLKDKVNQENAEGADGVEFDIGDNGKEEELMFSGLQADALLINLLFKFNDRQKIILMYQVLRESGYNLNHGDCAKTLSLTREHYMFLLKGVKKKAVKVLQGIT